MRIVERRDSRHVTAAVAAPIHELAKGRTDAPLTSKEIECLRWCKEGKTNWEIGEILSISEKTVEFHLSNSIRKLGVTNRITAVVRSIQYGVIPL